MLKDEGVSQGCGPFVVFNVLTFFVTAKLHAQHTFKPGVAEAELMKEDGSLPTRPHPKNPKITQYRLTEEIHRKTFKIELDALIKTEVEADESTYQLWLPI